MIYIFGSTGMLGRYIYTYLKHRACMPIVAVDRFMIDAEDVNLKYFSLLGITVDDVVINCVGLIPQRGVNDVLQYLLVNSVFPHKIAEYCERVHANHIHVTTDCVFDGTTSFSNEETAHNALDLYGRSKSLGEPDGATCIRTSIIGEELYNKKSLLEWIKLNKNSKVRGFTTHLWNGITCLQFAKICEEVIKRDMFWHGVRHLYSPDAISKYDLIKMVSNVFELNVEVTPYEDKLCDRTLSSKYPKVFEIPSLEEQLIELRDYYHVLRK